jgi:hypothetical protein
MAGEMVGCANWKGLSELSSGRIFNRGGPSFAATMGAIDGFSGAALPLPGSDVKKGLGIFVKVNASWIEESGILSVELGYDLRNRGEKRRGGNGGHRGNRFGWHLFLHLEEWGQADKRGRWTGTGNFSMQKRPWS